MAEINPELTAALQKAVEIIEDELCGLRLLDRGEKFLQEAKLALANRSTRWACTSVDHHFECECRKIRGVTAA
jgi:hypothetical protein